MAGGRPEEGTASARRGASNRSWEKFKEEVKSRYRIDQAIEDFAGIRLSGRSGQESRMGRCPFHDDKNPSMSVRPDEGYFRCHAAGCGARGDIFTFISLHRNVDFHQAVLMAAERVGLQPPDGAGSGLTAGNAAKPRAKAVADRRTGVPSLLDCDLVPAFPGIRRPDPGVAFPVWHPGGGRTAEPGVKRYTPEMIHAYHDIDDRLVMFVLRCAHGGGGKYFIPIRVGILPESAPEVVVDDPKRRAGWVVGGTTPGHRKPIYGIERARSWIADGGKRILIVEGEKTRDAAARMLSRLPDADDWLILSPMGGHNASLHADWSAFMREALETGLAGVEFTVWPDADHPRKRSDGTEADPQKMFAQDTVMAFATAMLKARMDPTAVKYSRVLPGTDRESGWDLADAEDEGWDADPVILKIGGSSAEVRVQKRRAQLRTRPATR